MRKPPPLLPAEVQKITAQRTVAAQLQVMKFISEKLGMAAIGEFNNMVAEQMAPVFRTTQIPKVQDGALKFALINGIMEKNIYGSEVEIPVDGDDLAVLEIKKCALLPPIDELKQKGYPVQRELYCMIHQGQLGILADKLGLKVKGENTEKGCKLTIEVKKK